MVVNIHTVIHTYGSEYSMQSAIKKCIHKLHVEPPPYVCITVCIVTTICMYYCMYVHYHNYVS